MTKVVVKQPPKPEDAIPTEVIATAIVDISQGIKKIRAGRLTDRAIILLIKDTAPNHLTFQSIKLVLDGMESLERVYLKKKP